MLWEGGVTAQRWSVEDAVGQLKKLMIVHDGLVRSPLRDPWAVGREETKNEAARPRDVVEHAASPPGAFLDAAATDEDGKRTSNGAVAVRIASSHPPDASQRHDVFAQRAFRSCSLGDGQAHVGRPRERVREHPSSFVDRLARSFEHNVVEDRLELGVFSPFLEPRFELLDPRLDRPPGARARAAGSSPPPPGNFGASPRTPPGSPRCSDQRSAR